MESCKTGGLNEVPVMIRKYNESRYEIALIENIPEITHSIEEAMAYKLMENLN